MKEAEKIIKRSEEWVNEDKKNRAAVVILANKKDEIWAHVAGTLYAIAHLIYLMMLKDKGLGHSIYAGACLYAHKYIAAEERDKINAVISAVAEERKKIEAIISARKKPKGGEK